MEPQDTIFLRGRDIADPVERAAYLTQACGNDAGLRQRVEAMLRDAAGADAFFGPEPAGATMTEGPGTVIGRYKLLQKIGEGGMGVVYMAEQREPVIRKVALKIIKLGMDTKQVIARFEAERQALALMDHPNIAKVLDAGSTDAGRPYFVMELVRGTKITDFCDQHNLSTRERLGLFIEICRAVQHAHQKGIIHRDLKPSNILVTMNDGVPVPKVIDFGIAKATTGQRLTDKTLFTAFEQFIGTPAYMSPEQAEMSERGIDTRGDIYSLGVLLYELLTGQTPFDSTTLQRAGLDEIRRIVREEEPALPSARLSTMADANLNELAKRRRVEPTKLSSIVRGELDWIVMKALEKDRTRRYETANGLATDVERYLADEPIVARPTSNFYRFRKLVRRHKTAFATVAAIAAALLAGAVVSTSEAIRARRAEREQTHLREQAQLEAERSREVAQFLKDMLQGVGPSVALGRDTKLLQEILDRTARRVSRDLTNQPEVEADLENTVGGAYAMLGDYTNAEVVERHALELRRKLWGEEHPATAESLHNLAATLKVEGNPQAEAMHREALAIRRKVLGKEDPAVAESLKDLALTLQRSNPTEAESLMREALAIDRKAWGEGDPRLVDGLRTLGLLLDTPGKYAEAEALLRQAVAFDRKSPEGETPDLATSLRNLAQVLQDEDGKLGQAEDAARESLAINRKLRESDNVVVADSLNVLAGILCDGGKLAEAEATALEALSLRHGCDPSDPEIVFARDNLGAIHERAGRWDKAASDFSQITVIERSNSYAHLVLAILLVENNDLPGYRVECGKMVSLFGASADPDGLERTAEACLLIPGGGCDLSTAGQMADRALTLVEKNQHVLFFELHKGLADYRRGKFASTANWMHKVIEAGNPDWNCNLGAYAVLAMAQHQLHHDDEAGATLAQGMEISRTKMPQLESGNLGDDAGNWLIAHILLREAKALIKPE